MTQVPVKSQPGFALPSAAVADVKFTCCCMLRVFIGKPPSDAFCPDVVVSQKLLVTVPKLKPIRPPTLVEPVTAPVE